jgi:hypothetical protein
MYSVRKGEQPWGTTRNEDRHERGWRAAAGATVAEGGTDRVGEKEEEAVGGLSVGLVVSNGLARLKPRWRTINVMSVAP